MLQTILIAHNAPANSTQEQYWFHTMLYTILIAQNVEVDSVDSFKLEATTKISRK
jgi:hypothetical protein